MKNLERMFKKIAEIRNTHYEQGDGLMTIESLTAELEFGEKLREAERAIWEKEIIPYREAHPEQMDALFEAYGAYKNVAGEWVKMKPYIDTKEMHEARFDYQSLIAEMMH